jgi:hypothetical protein
METPGSVPSTQAAPVSSAPDTAETDAPPVASGPVWRFLISPRWLGWHLFAVVAFWGMCWLGDWQLHRAISGNALSWAYTFEWPLFAVFGAVFWARTIRDEFRSLRGLDLRTGKSLEAIAAQAGPVLPDGLGTRPIDRPADDADDAERASYNAYLAKLNAEVKGHNKWLKTTS